MEPKIINNNSMRCMQLFMRDRVIDKDVIPSVTPKGNIMISKNIRSKDDNTKHVISSIEFGDVVTFMAAFYHDDKMVECLRNVVNPIPSGKDLLPPETAFDFLIVQFMGFEYEKLYEIYRAVKNGYQFGYDVVK